MKYNTKAEAEMVRKCGPFPHRHKVVKTKYMDLTEFTLVKCWTIVYTK